MNGDVQAKFEYGGLSLTCDESTFRRLRNSICDDAVVSPVLSGLNDDASLIRFITIRLSSENDEQLSKGHRWSSILLQAIAICIGGSITIVGLFTISRWLIRLFH